MKRRLLLACIVLGLFACERGAHPGYKELRPGLWFRLNMLGEGPPLPAGDELLHVRLRAALPSDEPGSLFSTERDYHAADLHASGLADVLDRSQLGDSVSVIADAATIVWERLAPGVEGPFPDTGSLALELLFMERLDRTRTVDKGLSAEQETALLDSLVAAEEAWVRWGTSRLHYQVLDAGTDSLPIGGGSDVTITYTGSLPDGRIIDGLRERSGELTFVFGDPDQVIEGLEVAVSLLHDGGRGRFLIPSELGFGPQGSGAGLVPPNTPLVYDVEVLRVHRGAVARP